jgi:hypothetical protein
MKYARTLPPAILLSMYPPFDPCLHYNRLFFQPVPDSTVDINACPGRREHHHDQKFCIRSIDPDSKNRYRNHVGEPGRDPSHRCFGYRLSGTVLVRFIVNRCLLQFYVHPTGNIYISLLDSPLHDGHCHCAVIDLFFMESAGIFSPTPHTIRSPLRNGSDRRFLPLFGTTFFRTCTDPVLRMAADAAAASLRILACSIRTDQRCGMHSICSFDRRE